MQIVQFFAAAILCIFVSHHVESLQAKALSKFPFLLNETFHFQIVPKPEKGNFSFSILDTMIIQIVDTAGLVKEKAIFYYGFQNKLNRVFHGSFMKIVKWELNSQLSAIDILIIFQPRSNFYIIEIYNIRPRSRAILENSLNDLNLANRIFRNSINLLNPSKLDLHVIPNQRKDSIWNVNDIVTVTCLAYDGIPKRIPLFENFKSLAIINSSFTPERNERMIRFTVRREDHLKTIKCVTDNISKSQVIQVTHRPSQIYIKQNDNKEIDCYIKDGFPTPTIKWMFISGPEDASKFYNITSNGTRLFINEKSPSKSKWEFECQIDQRIGSFITHMKRNFSIFVEKVKKPCNIECVNKKVSNLENISENVQRSLKKIENIQTKNEENTKNLRKEIKKEIFHVSKLTLNLVKELKEENVNLKQIHKSEINLLKRKLTEIQQELKRKFVNKTELDSIKNQVKEIRGKMNRGNVETDQSRLIAFVNFASRIQSYLKTHLDPVVELLNQKIFEINNNTVMIKEIIDKIKEKDVEKKGKGYWKRRKWRFKRFRKRPSQNDDDLDDIDK